MGAFLRRNSHLVKARSLLTFRAPTTVRDPTLTLIGVSERTRLPWRKATR